MGSRGEDQTRGIITWGQGGVSRELGTVWPGHNNIPYKIDRGPQSYHQVFQIDMAYSKKKSLGLELVNFEIPLYILHNQMMNLVLNIQLDIKKFKLTGNSSLAKGVTTNPFLRHSAHHSFDFSILFHIL